MSEEQLSIEYPAPPEAQQFEMLLRNLPEATDDRQQAELNYKEHLWAWVLIIEHVLQQTKCPKPEIYATSCKIIAAVAHYEGGRCRYLPRGDALKEELRNIEMFRRWNKEGQTVEQIYEQFKDDITMSQVYRVLKEKRQQYLAKVQQKLL